jgi:hypothetical protein
LITILVLAMFTTFLVVERFTQKPASEYEFQTSTRTEAEASKAQPMVAGFKILQNRGIHQVPTGIVRRKVERRGRESKSVA